MLSSDILHLVKPGDTVYYMEDTAANPCRTYYIVKCGDSMYSIAQMFNVSLNNLLAANPQITNPSLIYPGQKICIPGSSPAPGPCPPTPTPCPPTPTPCPPMPTPPCPQMPTNPIETPATPSAPTCQCQFMYTVRSGDSLFSIAQMFGVSLNMLIQCNPQITNPSMIFPGQQICIPASSTPFPCQCQTIYTVVSGDSLFTIAQRFGVPLNRLIQCNPQITNPSVIFPGQQVCIPVSAPPFPCQCQTIYTVRPGDSLFTIAQRFGVPLNRLIQCNPQITNPSSIMPGQQVCIPVSTTPFPCQCQTIYTVRPGDSLFTIAQRFGVPLNRLIQCNPQITNPSSIMPGQQVCIPVSATQDPSTQPGCDPMDSSTIPELKKDASSVLNIYLNNALKNKGYEIESDNINFDDKTEDAIKSMQKDAGYEETGVVDKKTWDLILTDESLKKLEEDDPRYSMFNYVVKSGDSLYSIALMFGTTVNAILLANPQITNPSLIYPGMVLRIPVPSPGPTPPHHGMRYVVKSGDTMYKIARAYGISLNALIKANPQISNPNVLTPGQVIFIPVSGASDVKDK